jgi:hypothetical protein
MQKNGQDEDWNNAVRMQLELQQKEAKEASTKA